MRHNKYNIGTKLSLHTGKVLCDIDDVTGETVMFVIAGVSYDDVALVRLFGQNGMNEVLVKKCYRLLGKILLPKAITNVSLPLYADVTNLIQKGSLYLIPLLNSKHNQHIFRIPKDDINHIISSIKGTNTISESVKSKYLSEFF